MISYRLAVKRVFFPLFLLAVVCFGQPVFGQDGKSLFMSNCASCHAVLKDGTGPALFGVEERVPDKKLLHAWIRNNQAVLASGNKYFNDLYNARNKTPMNQFLSLTDAEIDAILSYVQTEGVKLQSAQAAGGGGAAVNDKANSEDSTLLYGVLTLILAVIVFTMLTVNASLKKLSDEKEGAPAFEPVPFWRNKAYIALFAVVLFIVGGYYTIQGAIGLGRSQNYQPEQPIYYSHKVHAGTNQISCLYCHGGAQEGKHANIPSLNVCMNCHMQISEYGGEKLFREDGTEVNGTAEIKKIYEHTGWDPSTKKYANAPKPIEWVKIHNLPDHVYFNHAQHVNAGRVACQSCHGNIQEMGEVKQFADLSMGWCINCHRETKVQFNDNKFYSIYEKFHEELKSGKVDSVTVEMIGGTECQKCHY